MMAADDDMLKRLKGAMLDELYPGFDQEAEGERLAGKMADKPRIVRPFPVFRMAAALLLVVCVGGYLLWQDSPTAPVQQTVPVAIENSVPEVVPVKAREAKESITLRQPVAARIKRYSGSSNGTIGSNISPAPAATGAICNGTLCPIEICISQTMRCASGKQAEISECRTLEPDQSGRLQLKGAAEIEKDCHLTVDEIRITRVSTGETIILNSASQPASADDVFACLTGKADCSMMAGIFERDCNNNDLEGKLKIDARGGDVILRQ